MRLLFVADTYLEWESYRLWSSEVNFPVQRRLGVWAWFNTGKAPKVGRLEVDKKVYLGRKAKNFLTNTSTGWEKERLVTWFCIISVTSLRKIQDHSSEKPHSITYQMVSNLPHIDKKKTFGLVAHKPMTRKPRWFKKIRTWKWFVPTMPALTAFRSYFFSPKEPRLKW